jgi:hypothetical protein
MSSSPTVLAAGQLALLGRSGAAVAAAAPESLLDALGRVPDPRAPRGLLCCHAPCTQGTDLVRFPPAGRPPPPDLTRANCSVTCFEPP